VTDYRLTEVNAKLQELAVNTRSTRPPTDRPEFQRTL